MRIIGGRWRSRRIEWPQGGRTRPVSDRLKQALFDVLGCRFGTPGELPPICVADVFAGAGSMGLEAMSRGAKWVCFFDSDRQAVALLRRNLKTLEAGPQAGVVVGDIWRASICPPVNFPPLDLILLDPPFADTADTSERSKVASLSRRVRSSPAITNDTLLVIRHEAKIHWPNSIGHAWTLDNRRVYGRNAFSFFVPLAGGIEAENTQQFLHDADAEEPD